MRAWFDNVWVYWAAKPWKGAAFWYVSVPVGVLAAGAGALFG